MNFEFHVLDVSMTIFKFMCLLSLMPLPALTLWHCTMYIEGIVI